MSILIHFSQLDVIDWFAKNTQFVPSSIVHVPAGHVMTPTPICVKSSDRVFDAFKQCLKMKFSGIGVLNEEGNLVANLSVSILKVLTPENFQHMLQLSVKRFLDETGGMLTKVPKTVNYSDTLETVIKTLHNNHIHRVYVMQHNKPVGVVSVSDLVQLIGNEMLLSQRK